MVRTSRYAVVAVSTSESFATQRPPELLRAVDDREFAVVPMGYDKEQVNAYLGEVEPAFVRLRGGRKRPRPASRSPRALWRRLMYGLTDLMLLGAC